MKDDKLKNILLSVNLPVLDESDDNDDDYDNEENENHVDLWVRTRHTTLNQMAFPAAASVRSISTADYHTERMG